MLWQPKRPVDVAADPLEQEFAEPGTLSSTVPTDLPLPRTAAREASSYRRPVLGAGGNLRHGTCPFKRVLHETLRKLHAPASSTREIAEPVEAVTLEASGEDEKDVSCRECVAESVVRARDRHPGMCGEIGQPIRDRGCHTLETVRPRGQVEHVDDTPPHVVAPAPAEPAEEGQLDVRPSSAASSSSATSSSVGAPTTSLGRSPCTRIDASDTATGGWTTR
jgi:hypothetical protein